ncbi:DUF192 domain-containing protein [Candidatus Falkowbacteria bacterium]|uniref:DUF192 domain-containing protein n=1 Tax=Candidatus Falkowbacteria bacterium CG10_big_fil_rev_8_21_14_0_10_37_18 TaxID=1974562 RepID=A0A2H0V8H2_9BACT|nr:DUF192 domain-containing protein [Candidatus Falkowbacteria bacterium]NCQ12914.1 DUF192 domain-containing protein [Candidatus Falkowbacteria bacterium]OIO06350.1 MAG: hypothetical protein AUJ26_00895 [Candidatus Falkowbacteria bacterium CG1_02_37_21]PIR95407.1 MAG: hypothetical protein COT93_02630 [Candidatus Falkowbacteria bacterium CG10_big_fil_rev_8_21_14_0_10_37_18]
MLWTKSPNKFWLVITAVILLMVGIVFISILNFYSSPRILPTATVSVQEKTIKVELVATAADMYRGLSGRSSLCPDCGMLFNFPNSGERKFVMRDMKFPLDIVFISNGRIIKIDDNLAPAGDRPEIIYSSEGEANQVLELNAGYTTQNNINVGDFVSFNP